MDLRYGAGKVWPAGAVMAGLYLAYWAVMLLTGSAATPDDRIPVLTAYRCCTSRRSFSRSASRLQYTGTSTIHPTA